MKPLPLPRLDWTQGQARNRDHDDPYFSRADGLAESRHVFLDGNALDTRLAAAPRFCIGELGFGTGLNFLLSWQAWATRAPAGAVLDYIAVEAAPLSRAQLRRALAPWPELTPLREGLCAALPPRHAGFHSVEPAPGLRLLLLYGDVGACLPQCRARVDAWFLDGFAPARNPAMWSPAVLAQVARLSAPGASLATYSAAGHVRRALQAAGFAMEKRPGFGRKRHMLVGRRDATPCAPSPAPWFDYPAGGDGPVAIVGDGIVGACLARQLAEDGQAVQVFGADDGASARIPGFLVRPYPEATDSPASRLYALAFARACRFYARHVPAAFSRLRLGGQEGDLPAASLRPAAAVTALLEHPLIRRQRSGPCQIEADGSDWILRDEQGQLRYRGPRLLLCGARPPAGLPGTWPLRPCAGQVALTADAIEPAFAGKVHGFTVAGRGQIGSSYRPGEEAADIRPAESRQLLQQAGLAVEPADAAAGPRTVSPDHLPLLGPVPDLPRWARDYAGLNHGERHRAFGPGACLPGLWLNLGHGSRGATLAPLAALQLASALQGRPLPLPADLAAIAHPGRYAIRALKRGRDPLAD